MMSEVFILLTLLGLLGAFDNFYNHEWRVKLAHRPTAITELWLHAARQWLYTVLFAGLAWSYWHGWFAYAMVVVLLIEVFITLWDFVEEDRTRLLSPQERITHTLLTLFYGAMLAQLIPILWQWSQQPSAISYAYHGIYSWILTVYATGVLIWGIREAVAAVALQQKNRLQNISFDKENQHVF